MAAMMERLNKVEAWTETQGSCGDSRISQSINFDSAKWRNERVRAAPNRTGRVCDLTCNMEFMKQNNEYLLPGPCVQALSPA